MPTNRPKAKNKFTHPKEVMLMWFWITLALVYFVSAIVTFIQSKSVKRDLDNLRKEGPDSMLALGDRDISLNDTLYKAYTSIIISEIIGSVLATIAALYESGIICIN